MTFPIASRFATYCSVLAPPSVCLVFFHILEILSCNSHSQFSKSQLSSLTVYFWLLSGSNGNNKESTCFQLALVK